MGSDRPVVGHTAPAIACPICAPGEGVVAIDVTAARAAGKWLVQLAPVLPPAHPALTFGPGGAGPGPCGHLLYFALWPRWERSARRTFRVPPAGLEVWWRHPLVAEADRAAGGLFHTFLTSVLRSPDGRAYHPATPFGS